MIPDLVKHWRGKFFSENASADIEEARRDPADGYDAGDGGARPTGAGGKRQGKKKTKGGPKRGEHTTASSAAKKFVKTDDPWNIPPEDWTEIGMDMEQSTTMVPASFGDPIRNFTEHCHHLKAAEWKIFSFLLAPIYLKRRLPDEDYDEFINLVDAIYLCCDYEISVGDIDVVEARLKRFVQYYERRYYGRRWERLPACLPVFHQILHVAQGIRWAGPMYVYWQWPMERVCGMIAATARSRVSANRNMAITLALNERRNHLPYVIALPASNSNDEDSDGNVLLHRLFTKSLSGSNPPGQAQAVVLPEIFGKPTRSANLTTWQRRALKAYLDSSVTPGDIIDTGIGQIPAKCLCWASYSSNFESNFDRFTVISSTMRRGNSTRSSSSVMYTVKLVDGSKRTAFGEVIFFFTVDIGRIHHLAYVQQFSVQGDGRLLYRSGGREVKVVIEALSIVELVGLIKNGDRHYLIRKHTCMF